MSYHCPVCNKVSPTSMDLVRHMMGRGDNVHREWINTKGFNYSGMLAAQFQWWDIRQPYCKGYDRRSMTV